MSTEREGGAAPRTPESTLNTALLAYAIVALVYGVPILLIPQVFWGDIGGGSDVAVAFLEGFRWAGGVLGGLALGVLLSIREHRGQRTLVTAVALATAGAAVGLWVSALAGELDFLHAWFYWLATIVTSVLGLYLWWARFRARDILGL